MELHPSASSSVLALGLAVLSYFAALQSIAHSATAPPAPRPARPHPAQSPALSTLPSKALQTNKNARPASEGTRSTDSSLAPVHLVRCCCACRTRHKRACEVVACEARTLTTEICAYLPKLPRAKPRTSSRPQQSSAPIGVFGTHIAEPPCGQHAPSLAPFDRRAARFNAVRDFCHAD